MPRISCSNHKINLAVRSAIKNHRNMQTHLRAINIWITKIRKSVELTKVFANAKCRQRLDNDTRWGSTFLMLEQIVKAHKQQLLDEIKYECPCPVSLTLIKNYLSILKHAYFFNIGLQRQSATIAEVIPSVLKCISEWDIIKDKTLPSGKQLCELLIIEFKSKFNYELNSHLYLVSFLDTYNLQEFIIVFSKASAVLRVAFLNNWAIENFGIESYNKGILALSSLTCAELIREKKIQMLR